MASVDMCEHGWPGSGCEECRKRFDLAASKRKPVIPSDPLAELREAAERLNSANDGESVDAIITALRKRVEELEGALAELERANEIVATVRSMQTYEAMICDKGASSALIGLDDARRRARAALRAKGGGNGE